MLSAIIAFSGVQGCGKDTLARKVYNWLAEQLIDEGYDVCYFESVTRRVLKDYNIDLKKLRENVEGLKVWQYYSFKEFIESITDAVCAYDVVISPRGMEDFFVYTRIGIGQWVVSKLMDEFDDEIWMYDKHALKIYLEPLDNKDKIEDGIRDTSWYEKEVEEFEKIKDKFDLVVPKASVEERFEIVKRFLVDKLKL